MKTSFLPVLLLLCNICSITINAAEKELSLGKIDFPNSGAEAAQPYFIQGILALHSFWHEEARSRFQKAQEIDPGFAMAYWGEAMTHDNAFLTIPGDDNENLGTAVVARIDTLDTEKKLKYDERERLYINAIRMRFRKNIDRDYRRQLYAEAMEHLALQYPDDTEAIVFAELAFMALPGFDRNLPSHVVSVAARLEEIYQQQPGHPGVLHYLIHVYDTPTFAMMGLRQARIYAKVAPASSHALHMPSHIFRHLGMWEEVAASNEAAYQASVDWQERTGRPLHMRDYHAFEWLFDAYLALNRAEQAKRLMEELDHIEAQIKKRGEAVGEFPVIARNLRGYYQGFMQANR